MLRPNHPYGGPDFNPQFMPQFRGARRPMLPNSMPQQEFLRGHTITMRGPPNHMQRMPPGMQLHPSRMPVGPGHMGPIHQRMQRPPFQSSPAIFGNNPGMQPQGKIADINIDIDSNLEDCQVFFYFITFKIQSIYCVLFQV